MFLPRIVCPGSARARSGPRAATTALLAWALLTVSSTSLRAQTIDDAVMMPKNSLCTGFLYGNDRWDRYWEGTQKRGNENIGTITTQSLSWMGNYGVTNRLNVIVMLPYVWSGASQGVLHGMQGFQDLTLAGKFNLLESAFTSQGSLRAIVVASGAIPLSNYTPDFLPLSIGSASKRFSGRTTLSFQANKGWFLTGSASYTWRDKVTLDRAAYYTDGHLYFTNEVAMPDVFDYIVSAGYQKPGLYVPVSFTQQSTLGGGDIRRQDVPFVSNRMDYSKVDASVLYTIPRTGNLEVKIEASYTVSGRNVGQATTLMAGFLYVFHF
jgi:hypothetical protein